MGQAVSKHKKRMKIRNSIWLLLPLAIKIAVDGIIYIKNFKKKEKKP